MIATILPSSPTFHAIAYNERKVEKGDATLIEIKNMGGLETIGYSDASDLRTYMMEYSACNSRIKQPQFHLALSCKGHEYTPEQLLDFAHEYLKEMGYNDPDQPLLVYEHHDTDNTHLHIITSRVNPKGRKINDSNERRRSQKVLEKLNKQNLRKKAEEDLNVALQFDFRSATQFKAVMQAMNYECYEKDDKFVIKKGGMVQTSIESAIVSEIAEKNKLNHKNDVAENAKWRQILKKYRDQNTSRGGLERDLKNLFGMSLVFFGKSDSPYGYVAIDFNKKKVYEGGRLLGVKDLLTFRSPEEQMKELEEFIGQCFDQNPNISTKQLNRKLRRFGAFSKEGKVKIGDREIPLSNLQKTLLDRNNKIEWRNGFKPQSIQERDLLCRLTGFDYPELISYRDSSERRYYCKDYNELSAIFKINSADERFQAFQTAGFKFIEHNKRYYAYRPDTQTLVDLLKAGFALPSVQAMANINSLHTDQQEVDIRKTTANSLKPLRTTDSSRSDNREWEVGKRDNEDDMDRRDNLTY